MLKQPIAGIPQLQGSTLRRQLIMLADAANIIKSLDLGQQTEVWIRYSPKPKRLDLAVPMIANKDKCSRSRNKGLPHNFHRGSRRRSSWRSSADSHLTCNFLPDLRFSKMTGLSSYVCLGIMLLAFHRLLVGTLRNWKI